MIKGSLKSGPFLFWVEVYWQFENFFAPVLVQQHGPVYTMTRTYEPSAPDREGEARASVFTANCYGS